MIRVRFAGVEDEPRLLDFLRDHWSATHIFVDRPDVFSWQYRQDDDQLNMVLAEQETSSGSTVLGVLGFIPLGRFSPSLGNQDIMLAIWKVREDGVPPGVGLQLLKHLQRELSPSLIGAIGTSTMVRRIYKVLGYELGSLHQSAVFNPQSQHDLRIASGVPLHAFDAAPPVAPEWLELVEVDQTAPVTLRDKIDEIACLSTPKKNWVYICNRYMTHPWYQYQLRAVRHNTEIVALAVWRQVDCQGGRILRIVDLIGDPAWLRLSRFALQQEAIKADAEYIDLMQHGIETELLIEAGFVSPKDHPNLILPNHFDPFEARNVEVELAYKVVEDHGTPVRLFRADSDQDRPNSARDLPPARR